MCQISSELPECYRIYYRKHVDLFFPGHSVVIIMPLREVMLPSAMNECKLGAINLPLIGCNCLYTVSYVGTKTENIYGDGTGEIWLENVQCDGTETDIGECSHNGWGVHQCEHHDDVAIFCTTGKLRPAVHLSARWPLLYSFELPEI